jgi:hypothetical protein
MPLGNHIVMRAIPRVVQVSYRMPLGDLQRAGGLKIVGSQMRPAITYLHVLRKLTISTSKHHGVRGSESENKPLQEFQRSLSSGSEAPI